MKFRQVWGKTELCPSETVSAPTSATALVATRRENKTAVQHTSATYRKPSRMEEGGRGLDSTR